jgi:hypothetical protein
MACDALIVVCANTHRFTAPQLARAPCVLEYAATLKATPITLKPTIGAIF